MLKQIIIFIAALQSLACTPDAPSDVLTRGDSAGGALVKAEEIDAKNAKVGIKTEGLEVKAVKGSDQDVVTSLTLTAPDVQALLRSLPLKRAHLPDDPYYQRGRMEFEGYAFEDILQLMDGLSGLDLSAHSLRFVCTDGYKTTYPFSAVQEKGGVLAIHLIEQEKPVPFPVITTGKAAASAGPFYLVWDGRRYGEKRPWPYQLERIEVLSNKALAARWEPPLGSQTEKGFYLFTKHCVACHAMNLKGGAMGPELNVPQNILSYRARSQLLAFMKDPQSFRTGSLMPPTHLDDEDLNLVLDYLEAMGRKQVCQTKQSCEALVQRAPKMQTR